MWRLGVVLLTLAACGGGENFRTDAVRAEVEAIGADAWSVPFDEVVDVVREGCMNTPDDVFALADAMRDNDDVFARLERIGCPWRFDD